MKAKFLVIVEKVGLVLLALFLVYTFTDVFLGGPR